MAKTSALLTTQYRACKSLLLLLLCAANLSSCVTTTSGGFNVDASDENALEDYVQLATAYYDEGDMAGARRHINNALAIDDGQSSIYNVLALVLQREGDIDLADETFRRAIRLDGGNSRARNNYAAFLFSADRYEEAYEQLLVVTADTAYEGRSVAFESLGRAARSLDRIDQAKSAFQRSLQLDANRYLSALELAELEYSTNSYDAARAALLQYVTTVDFYQIPHTPRALLAGIKIEREFPNSELLNNFILLLTQLYQDSPEYRQYQRLANGR